MSKILLIFVLLSVTGTVVQCGSTDSTSSSEESDEIQIIRKATTDVFKALGEFFVNVGTNAKKAFENLTKKVVYAFSLRCYLLIMVSGVSYDQFPYFLNEKYFSIATSAVKLCGKLNAMEKCHDIVTNASLETADYVLSGGVKKNDVDKTIKYFMNAIETKIEEDVELLASYKQIERNLPRIQYWNTSATGIFQNRTALREVGIQALKFMLYKMHVRHSFVNILTTFKKDYYVTARSVIELAKQPSKSEAIQELYDNAIPEVVELMDLDASKLFFDAAAADLYEKLEKGISSNPSLKDDYEVIKKIVENSSKWTRGLFDFDLLPW